MDNFGALYLVTILLPLLAQTSSGQPDMIKYDDTSKDGAFTSISSQHGMVLVSRNSSSQHFP